MEESAVLTVIYKRALTVLRRRDYSRHVLNAEYEKFNTYTSAEMELLIQNISNLIPTVAARHI